MKTTRILAISVLVLVVGFPAGVEAYGNVEKYWALDSDDDTWLLLWEWLDGGARVGGGGGVPSESVSVGGGGGVPTESISVGGGGGVPTESVGEADVADCFLKIDGVPGESTDEGHADWIEVIVTGTDGEIGTWGSLIDNKGGRPRPLYVSQTAGGDRSTGGAATN